MRRLFALLCACAVALLVPVPAVAAEPHCQPFQRSVPVLLGKALMSGTLCRPDFAHTVVVLIPGATYNRAYWDFPHRPEAYSFRKALNAAGYATAVVDRLGAGESSRPLGTQVTTPVQVGAVREVVRALRAAEIDGTAFDRVVLAGHALGATIAIGAAGVADALLVTGLAHQANAGALAELVAGLAPAAKDALLGPRGYDPTYLTTKPGVRGQLFHALGADPEVVKADEATKDVVLPTEAVDAVGLAFVGAQSALVKVPVLTALGGSDRYMCGVNCLGLAAAERPFYPAAPCVEGYVLPDAGHAMALSTKAPEFHRAATAWLGRIVAGAVRC
ncbi:alpha/beta fold hydrolase [Allokutzneria sp. A3M-2-11 16]|uniref:alpha/beta hydrolase n=1 Tax=Allokutzneria sp. A3M-2-11 16 TaxID=2962043 RepID=UPI0020B6DBBE|nr:alpha/beta fold hydrolase [Allokutzneria sp. A3M-2-11 16]MCP3804544.1 alpha/beta fold hydrolase [Allokutzneria sp. A3M-2-11 16]